jgi:hypothetical protein
MKLLLSYLKKCLTYVTVLACILCVQGCGSSGASAGAAGRTTLMADATSGASTATTPVFPSSLSSSSLSSTSSTSSLSTAALASAASSSSSSSSSSGAGASNRITIGTSARNSLASLPPSSSSSFSSLAYPEIAAYMRYAEVIEVIFAQVKEEDRTIEQYEWACRSYDELILILPEGITKIGAIRRSTDLVDKMLRKAGAGATAKQYELARKLSMNAAGLASLPPSSIRGLSSSSSSSTSNSSAVALTSDSSSSSSSSSSSLDNLLPIDLIENILPFLIYRNIFNGLACTNREFRACCDDAFRVSPMSSDESSLFSLPDDLAANIASFLPCRDVFNGLVCTRRGAERYFSNAVTWGRLASQEGIYLSVTEGQDCYDKMYTCLFVRKLLLLGSIRTNYHFDTEVKQLLGGFRNNIAYKKLLRRMSPYIWKYIYKQFFNKSDLGALSFDTSDHTFFNVMRDRSMDHYIDTRDLICWDFMNVRNFIGYESVHDLLNESRVSHRTSTSSSSRLLRASTLKKAQKRRIYTNEFICDHLTNFPVNPSLLRQAILKLDPILFEKRQTLNIARRLGMFLNGAAETTDFVFKEPKHFNTEEWGAVIKGYLDAVKYAKTPAARTEAEKMVKNLSDTEVRARIIEECNKEAAFAQKKPRE